MASMGNPTNGPPGQRNDSSGVSSDSKIMLNTYIHNYFLKEGMPELAKNLRTSGLQINQKFATNLSKGNNANGHDDGDSDSKGDSASMMPGSSATETFILDWWSLFWDFFMAAHNRLHPEHPVNHYLAQQQQQARMRSQGGPGLFQNPGMVRMGVKQGQNETHIRALHNNLKNINSIPNPNARMPQNPLMHRDGSDIDMNGQQRAQSPMGDSAPSPKRQRLDGSGLAGPQINPMNRPPGMVGQFPNGGIPPSSMMMGGPPKIAQQFMNPTGTSADMMTAANLQRAGNGGALADYQMQLMLLEQQNKKRLMMARQEQEVGPRQDGSVGPGGMMMPAATAMSHDGSRTGQSPGPNDPTKRGTPTMGTNSPRPDGTMPPGRGSPGAAGFDPNTMPGMAHAFVPMPSGQVMRGPGGPQMIPTPGSQIYPSTPQQMEQIRQHQAALRVNGWAGGPQIPGHMPAGPHMPQQPQPLPDASQPRTAMPPPSAPSATNNNNANNINSNANANNVNNANANSNTNAVRNQTSSPQQPAAPATPSTTSKAAPKKKDTKDNKKKPTKKGPTTTGATPTSTAEGEDSIPNSQTPVTPQNANSFNKVASGQVQTSQPQGHVAQPPNPMPMNMMPPDHGANANHFGDAVNEPAFPMEFGDLNSENVLSDFDFDSFLHIEMDPSMEYEGNGFMNTDPVETGTGDV